MRKGGFTLLEMIVVLAILGLASALVAPAAVRSIDSWRREAQVDALLDQIRALPGNARAQGELIAIDDAVLSGEDAPLRIEGDWSLTVPEAWSVHANGVCEGGQVVIGNALGTRTIQVAAPFCDPVPQP
jgi:general secretion pathway protein G